MLSLHAVQGWHWQFWVVGEGTMPAPASWLPFLSKKLPNVDSGLFLCYGGLMDTLFSGSVKSIARFIHLNFTGLPPTKMSQTPEIHLRSAALTFGWALV